MESTEIHTIGTQIFTGFEHLVSETGLNQLPQHHSSLVTEEQKFRLWAYSLGLNRKGHSSLDYRVRDAVVMKESLVEVLTDLRQHMNALIDIALERRRPFEDEPDLQIQEDEGNSTSSESTTESVNESSSSSQSRGSFHEVDFRMHSIVARIDTLFILATKIRNPQTRQQRPLEQLFKNIPREQRSEHIEERERAEIMALAYLYRQEPRDDSHIEKDVPQGDESTPTCNYPAGSVEQPHWLIERIGCGNARRKQQFEFWKMHSTMPQKPVQEIPPMEVANLPDTHTFPDPMVPEASLATSVTKFIDRSKGTTDDHSEVRSTISYESRAPTSINPIRETLEWPEPPPVTSDGNPYFICPYCYLLCPIEYLAPKAWRTHLTYDLQPYQCTYQECNDSRRIYGSKREWIQHEAQHYKPIEEGPFVAIPVTECPRGDCPLCHKAFSDTAKLQRHMIDHLERFALRALPPIRDKEDNSKESDDSTHSTQAQRVGRRLSVQRDFDSSEPVYVTNEDQHTNINVQFPPLLGFTPPYDFPQAQGAPMGYTNSQHSLQPNFQYIYPNFQNMTDRTLYDAKTESKPRMTEEEVRRLEEVFQDNPKPSSSMKAQLADELNLERPRINNWYQNRRAKAKQEKKQEEYKAQTDRGHSSDSKMEPQFRPSKVLQDNSKPSLSVKAQIADGLDSATKRETHSDRGGIIPLTEDNIEQFTAAHLGQEEGLSIHDWLTSYEPEPPQEDPQPSHRYTTDHRSSESVAGTLGNVDDLESADQTDTIDSKKSEVLKENLKDIAARLEDPNLRIEQFVVEDLGKLSRELKDDLLRTKSGDTLEIVNTIANTLWRQHKYEEAKNLYKLVLQLSKEVLGGENPFTLAVMENIATLLHKKGVDAEAERLYDHVLEIRRKVAGDSHPGTLNTMDNLAVVYSAQKKFSDAEELFGRVVEERSRILGGEHPDTLSSMSNLAVLYYEQGDLGKAERLLGQVLAKRRMVLSAEHPDTLSSMSNLGGIYNKSGRTEEAERLLGEVLEGQRRVLGREHADTLRSINNLAIIYEKQGKMEEAKNLLREVLEGQRKVLGREHPDTLSSMSNLAAIYQRQGRMEEAEDMYQQTLELRYRVLGTEHPDTLSSMSNLAAIYQRQGRMEMAEDMYQQTFELRYRVLGTEHPDTLSTMSNLAAIYERQGKMERAEDMRHRMKGG